MAPTDIDLLGDGLHPTEAGYRLMGERFAEVLPDVVGQR